MRRLSDTSGAFVRFDLVPCGAILTWALLRVSASVVETSRLSGARVKRGRFGKYRCAYFCIWVGILVLFVVRASVGFCF